MLSLAVLTATFALAVCLLIDINGYTTVTNNNDWEKRLVITRQISYKSCVRKRNSPYDYFTKDINTKLKLALACQFGS